MWNSGGRGMAGARRPEANMSPKGSRGVSADFLPREKPSRGVSANFLPREKPSRGVSANFLNVKEMPRGVSADFLNVKEMSRGVSADFLNVKEMSRGVSARFREEKNLPCQSDVGDFSYRWVRLFCCWLRYMYPNQRRMSFRLATTMSSMRMPKPTYSALIMKFSEGLRRVIIS